MFLPAFLLLIYQVQARLARVAQLAIPVATVLAGLAALGRAGGWRVVGGGRAGVARVWR